MSNSFKVIPFHFKILVHLFFPEFSTLLEGIFWDVIELHHCGNFNGIGVRKMGSLQNRFDLGEEEEVTEGQIGVIWGVLPKLPCSFL